MTVITRVLETNGDPPREVAIIERSTGRRLHGFPIDESVQENRVGSVVERAAAYARERGWTHVVEYATQ